MDCEGICGSRTFSLLNLGNSLLNNRNDASEKANLKLRLQELHNNALSDEHVNLLIQQKLQE